jgi:hypothetical protein
MGQAMKNLGSKSLAILLITIFSVIALAADKGVVKKVHLQDPTVVGTTLLPAGDYKVTITNDTLSFRQINVLKGKPAEGSVKVLSTEKAQKPRSAIVYTGSNDKNQVVMTSIVFGGLETKYVVSK